MSKIKLMSENLSNKIAAGEVVEKCMNVVKELVENSIDAKATSIKIELKDSGVKEIKVIDDGIGMDKEDSLLCFERHATSKIINENDLFHIKSLGFRGEAIPSIASVSNFTLRTSNLVTGTEVVVDGGNIISVKNSDLAKGTTIIVNNLFYNTPVRLKYLKNLYTELSYITDYINKMALSYPDISFTLTNNDKLLLHTDGSNRLLKVINDIYGLSVTKKMIEIKGSNDDYDISGYISYPEIQKASKNSITILVNGRVIRNLDIIRYITDSYHTYMANNRYPICVIKIDVDPSIIDVNVHPTKMDVKFSKIDTLKDLLQSLVKEKLESLTLIPDAILETNIIEDNKTKISTVYIDKANYFDQEKKDKEFKTLEKEYEVQTLNFDVHENNEPLKKEYRIKKMYPIGVVHATFIVCENEDGMYLVDQHAAAERINYEYFLKEISNPKREYQDLLVPIEIELTSNEYLILTDHFDLLDKLGFEYNEFGNYTLLIRKVPLWLTKIDLVKAIRAIIDIIVDKKEFALDKFLDHTAATIACKASIRANDSITLKDMEYLVDRLRECDNPFSCPHGRPSIISYSNYDLEKLFKRSIC